jgi:hypothetical protein
MQVSHNIFVETQEKKDKTRWFHPAMPPHGYITVVFDASSGWKGSIHFA